MDFSTGIRTVLPYHGSRRLPMQKITPFLWFETQAEEAAEFYCSVFKDSKIKKVTRFGEVGPGPKGSVMTVEFELGGLGFVALNGGPHDKFNDAVSFAVTCETQAEVDDYWTKLTAEDDKEVQYK